MRALLERRLGSAGAVRGRLEHDLLSRLPALAGPRTPVTAWEDTVTWAVAGETPLVARAVHGLPGWDVHRAQQVFCWGARLAELGLPAGGRRDVDTRAVIREAGLFNLAVACFDTVADEVPSQLPQLARSLHPSLLARRLDGLPGSRLTTGVGRGPLEGIAELFDASLASTGRRLRDRPEQRRHLVGLLTRMYDSETGASADPLPAKTLPVVYLGRLADAADGDGPTHAARVDVLFEELACFVAAWDDYQDLVSDWAHGRANRYLRAETASRPAGRGASLAVGARRVLFPRRSQAQISQHLTCSLERVMAAAVQAERAGRVERVLTRLVAGRP